MKRALVTGSTGQDGAYLCNLLIDKGYEVLGTYRRSSTPNTWRLDALGLTHREHFALRELDVTDPMQALCCLRDFRPDEIYNLAAQSFVGLSFEQPLATSQVTGIGVMNLLEAVRNACPDARFYQASTSEMFGKVHETPQSETTPFHPRSPYGVAKLYAHWATVNYREAYGLFACSGILFNHESPLRGEEFVTRKISKGLARVKLGKQPDIALGNLDALRDWGYAGDYVDGMWRMLQADEPDTYVLATGRCESVRAFVELAATAAGFDLEWAGEGQAEVGVDRISGNTIVRIDPRFHRPAEVDLLLGDASKAFQKLKWKASMSLEALAERMVSADLNRERAAS